MTDLTGKLISRTYKNIVLVSSAVSNTGVETSLKPIQTGDGAKSALEIASNIVKVNDALNIAGLVSATGNIHSDQRVCASAFYGDGSNISGVTAEVAGNISVSNAVVGGTLQVSSTATIVGNTHLQAAVSVGGAAQFGSTVTVDLNVAAPTAVTVLLNCAAPDTVTVEPNCAAPPTDTAA